MVTLKGYTTDVWGAEIYAKDNRYGRYQSYGSVQIMGKGNPVSRAGSGFVQEGWDWNRLPGTTTIHLPFELLDSPLKGTTMARSTENFSGSSSLGGMNGMFAMKLTERDYENFTPDFVARKSVFCFDNRMICSEQASRTAMLTILRRPLSSRRNLTAKSRRQVRITIGCTTAMIIIIM